MSTLEIQQRTIYGLGEGSLVADSTMLAYALRWCNSAYRELFLRYRFKHLRTRTIFRTTDGQQTYQAPSDLVGFLILKDETNSTIMGQITPEEFQRDIAASSVSDETFTVAHNTAVSLDKKAIVQYSETVADDADHTTVYTRDTDYTMGYAAGTITVDSTGSITNSATTYIDYLHYSKGKPNKFCIEYDETNTRYVFRVDPVPDATYIASLLYSALPSDLSDSVDALWGRLEFALERGGIYYGSLEIIEDAQKRVEFKQIFETAMQALVQLDQELIPKSSRIPIRLKRTDMPGETTFDRQSPPDR